MRIAHKWLIVAASISGMMVGSAAVSTFGFSVLLRPMSAALGISRGDFSTALWIAQTMTSVGSIIFGFMIDRFGIKRVMLPALVCYSICVCCLALLSRELLWLLLPAFGLAGFFAACQQPIAYVKMTSLWFDRRRGLALGLAVGGVGAGTMVVPQITNAVNSAFSWHAAFLTLGGLILLLAFLPVLLAFRNPHHNEVDDAEPGSDAREEELIGVELGAALSDSVYWRLMLAFFLAVSAINGTLVHLVAMLSDRGLSAQQATNVLSLAGLFLIVGRVISGWCLDRFPGRSVAAVFVLLPMAGLGVMMSEGTGIWPALGGILCGLGIGAEVDLIAFFLGRYFGTLTLARLFGISAAVLSFGTATGPWIMGQVHDATHSYQAAMIGFEFALVGALLLFATLGAYRYLPRSRH